MTYAVKGVSMHKIVIIDDHQLFLYGLKLTLENEGNVVTTFDSPLKALTQINSINPDLILMDLYMPEMPGVEVLKALAKAKIASPVVVLSACDTYQDVYYALQHGAMGFIPKNYSPQALIDALDLVFAGDLFVPEDLISEIESVAKKQKQKQIHIQKVAAQQEVKLSERQIQILKLIHGGKKNREIADELCISKDTVKFHQKGLYSALQVSGTSCRIQAIKKALSIGLLKA